MLEETDEPDDGEERRTDDEEQETAEPSADHGGRTAKREAAGKKRDSYKQREREQLRSYLQPEGETDSTRERDGLSDEQRRKVDAAAVDAVVAYEERVGRTPERMPHENEGFDVRSTAADGSVRYIEVKGTSPQWDRQGVALSSRQFQEALTRTEEFWLYVVEVGKPGADPIRIQDPANRVRQYFFDSGWRIADEERERVVRPLPQLLIHAEPPAVGGVRLIDWRDGATELGWIELDIEQPSPDAYCPTDRRRRARPRAPRRRGRGYVQANRRSTTGWWCGSPTNSTRIRASSGVHPPVGTGAMTSAARFSASAFRATDPSHRSRSRILRLCRSLGSCRTRSVWMTCPRWAHRTADAHTVRTSQRLQRGPGVGA